MRELQDKSVAIEASEIVAGGRQDTYGDPVTNLTNIAKIWEVILGTDVTPRQVAKCMIALKLARDNNLALRDNEVDICGYAILMQYCREDGEPMDVSDIEDLGLTSSRGVRDVIDGTA